MPGMNRRSLIVMLIGAVSALSGLSVATLLAQNRCVDAGGQWNAGGRECLLPGGGVEGFGAHSIGLGLVVAVLLAFMLYRAVIFLAIRASRPEAG